MSAPRLTGEQALMKVAAQIMGRKGGSATSAAKKRSSPINGKKGGRPKKPKAN